jgi:hypothetical protein
MLFDGLYVDLRIIQMTITIVCAFGLRTVCVRSQTHYFIIVDMRNDNVDLRGKTHIKNIFKILKGFSIKSC